jgi:hypothetical protein
VVARVLRTDSGSDVVLWKGSCRFMNGPRDGPTWDQLIYPGPTTVACSEDQTPELCCRWTTCVDAPSVPQAPAPGGAPRRPLHADTAPGRTCWPYGHPRDVLLVPPGCHSRGAKSRTSPHDAASRSLRCADRLARTSRGPTMPKTMNLGRLPKFIVFGTGGSSCAPEGPASAARALAVC